MSIEQLAAATKIPRRSLELLEEDRYDALPGPVFAKGFLRCAARALGVDVEMVMDLLYERERAAMSARRRERPTTGSSLVATARPMPAIPSPSASRAEARSLASEPAASASSTGGDDAMSADERAEPTTTEVAAEPPTRRPSEPRRRAPRLRARPSAAKSALDRVRARLPSPALFLWVVVAAFVAMVVLAAFNIVGGAAAGGPS